MPRGFRPRPDTRTHVHSGLGFYRTRARAARAGEAVPVRRYVRPGSQAVPVPQIQEIALTTAVLSAYRALRRTDDYVDLPSSFKAKAD